MVASAWIGNSIAVATKHYLQMIDDHFTQAVQNPVQQVSADERSDAHAPKPTCAEPIVCSVVRSETTPCKGKGLVGIGDTGLEPVTSRV